MPEPEYGHYGIEELNYGYIYTNIDKIVIKEDLARGYIAIHTSRRREDYENVALSSCYSERHRERTRLSPLFIELFLQEAKNYNLKGETDTDVEKIDLKLMSDWKAEDIDSLVGTTLVGDKPLEASAFDLQRLFDFFVRENLTPFYPEDRSVGRVKEAIYKFFEKEFGMEYRNTQESIVRTVLGNRNIQHFVNVIDKTKEIYQENVRERELALAFDKDWNVPSSLNFGGDYIEESREKSIMQPFYSRNGWKTEKAFIELLEKSEQVAWWFKNGDRDSTFFAVPYVNGEEKPFYVDFIVKLKDERIGLFDTKSGITIKVSGPKMDGLYRYIQGENKRDSKLFGGIVTNTDQTRYRGRWVYFDKPSSALKENLSNWKNLEM